MRNRYRKVAHFSEAKFRQILKCFALDLTATDTMTGLSRNTINTLFTQIRQRLLSLAHQEDGDVKSYGTFECDWSYFGARRIKVNAGAVLRGKPLCLGY